MAFSNAPRQKLNADLLKLGIKKELLKYDAVLAGRESPEVQIVGVDATPEGIVSHFFSKKISTL
jgi:hypothetical protein